jgi:hypothetical protein
MYAASMHSDAVLLQCVIYCTSLLTAIGCNMHCNRSLLLLNRLMKITIRMRVKTAQHLNVYYIGMLIILVVAQVALVYYSLLEHCEHSDDS